MLCLAQYIVLQVFSGLHFCIHSYMFNNREQNYAPGVNLSLFNNATDLFDLEFASRPM